MLFRSIVVGLLLAATCYFLLSLGLRHPTLLGLHPSNLTYLALVLGLSGLAFGISGPAMNNAAIELAPQDIAAITGLRAMFRTLGSSIGGAMIILVTSHSGSIAQGLQRSFLGLAALTASSLLLVRSIPGMAAPKDTGAAPASSPSTADPAEGKAHDRPSGDAIHAD